VRVRVRVIAHLALGRLRPGDAQRAAVEPHRVRGRVYCFAWMVRERGGSVSTAWQGSGGVLRSAMRGPEPPACRPPHTHQAAARVAAHLAA
jgi:hypothetical protein